MAAYDEQVGIIASDVLATATTWNDFESALSECSNDYGVPFSTVGDDVLADITARFESLS